MTSDRRRDPITTLYRAVRRREKKARSLSRNVVSVNQNSAHRSPESTAYIMVSGTLNSAHRSARNLVSHVAKSAHRSRRYRVAVTGTHARTGRVLVAWTKRGLCRQLEARFAAAERMSVNPCGYGII